MTRLHGEFQDSRKQQSDDHNQMLMLLRDIKEPIIRSAAEMENVGKLMIAHVMSEKTK